MLIEDLKKSFTGDISTDDATLEKYSHDYSIFKVRPQAVVFPRDVRDVKKLVRFADKNKISLTARSGGTDMGGGPLNDGLILDFTKYFNHTKEIGSNYAIVEPGVYFRNFEAEISKKGLLYPPYPASKNICALGGMIANNSGGEKTLAYGKTEDYIESLRVVMSDGEEHVIKPLSLKELQAEIKGKNFEAKIYKKIYNLIEKNYKIIQAAKPNVSKNSAGYFLWNVWDKKTFNLNKLFVGSQGTLGLVTEAKLRLVKDKKYKKVAVVFLPDLKPVADLVLDLLKLKPESLESYDDKTLGVALKFLPAIIKSMKGGILKLAWQFLPEAKMVLFGGLPKMVLIMLLSSDDKNELEQRIAPFDATLKKYGVRGYVLKNEASAEKYWTIRRQSFKLLHDYSTGLDAASFVDDFIVKPEYLPEFLPKVNAILDEYKDKLVYTIAGHPGDGNFHIIPLMDLKKPEVRAIIPEISERIYNLVIKYKGSITAEHNDGIIRTPYLEKMYGKKMVKLFAETKKIFDPKNIFNPGKKTGAKAGDSLKYISSSSG